jgi:hypothetical protein
MLGGTCLESNMSESGREQYPPGARKDLKRRTFSSEQHSKSDALRHVACINYKL